MGFEFGSWQHLCKIERESERIPGNSLGNYNRVTRERKLIPASSAQGDSESAQAAQTGLRNAHPWFRLERWLLRTKDGNGLWWTQLSSEIIVEVLLICKSEARNIEVNPMAF